MSVVDDAASDIWQALQCGGWTPVHWAAQQGNAAAAAGAYTRSLFSST
jgi:hypothetical protein